MRHTFQFSKAVVCLAAWLALTSFLGKDASGQSSLPKTEKELIAILRSDAPKAEKALACKNLSVYGSSESVADLAKLLEDEQLASWCRTALEAIPGEAADEALRKAAGSLKGKLLVGVINSIGVRRDAGAVELLSGQLEDKEADVASAAAVALGKIGNEAAAKSLRPKLTGGSLVVRSAVADGCILCAERFLADGNGAEATKIYDEVRKAEVPHQRIVEATRGAILARGKEGIPLLEEQLRSADKKLFEMSLSTAREFPGSDVDQTLAAELEKAPPERAALVILAMADRKETVKVAPILKAAESGNGQVRLAAIGSLGRVGDATCLAPLLEIALETDPELSTAAKEALVILPGETVDKDIAARLAKADAKSYPVLIELVGQRRIDASDALLKAIKHSDKGVRAAALKALGNTASQKYLSVLINQVVTPASADDAEVAQKALKTAAIRMPDREACAAELADALEGKPLPTQTALLEILGAVQGTKALAAVGAAAKGTDPALQDLGSELLGKWTTIDAAPVLLSVAKGGGKFQTRALRGYIGISQKFTMSEAERAQMCTNALELARQPAERKLIFDVLKRYPNLEMLKVAVKTMETADLKKDASDAAAAIALKLPKTDEVKAILSKAGLDK
ncbi:MAG: HEAT repeat domain-containing protein [Pirellulaceae bacterium]